jgi:hypothetical protein
MVSNISMISNMSFHGRNRRPYAASIKAAEMNKVDFRVLVVGAVVLTYCAFFLNVICILRYGFAASHLRCVRLLAVMLSLYCLTVVTMPACCHVVTLLSRCCHAAVTLL